MKKDVIATYYIETKENLKSIAQKMAFEETTGGWSSPNEGTVLLKKATGKVLDVKEMSKGKGIVRILIPTINMNLDEAAFPHLWMFIAGGPAFELTCYRKIRLLDV